MASGKAAQEDEKMSGNEDDQKEGVEAELLPSYQILLSTLSLLTRAESAKSTQLTHTAELLK